MLTISKPLSAGQAQSYHQTEFTAEEQYYRSQHGVTVGGWQGRLATFRRKNALSDIGRTTLHATGCCLLW